MTARQWLVHVHDELVKEELRTLQERIDWEGDSRYPDRVAALGGRLSGIRFALDRVEEALDGTR